MGAGIAQVAASNGHPVKIYDNNAESLTKAEKNFHSSLNKLVDKEKISKEKADDIFSKIEFCNALEQLKPCHLVIEAILENVEIKKKVFKAIEEITDSHCILASNTSSLSITSIASACHHPEKVAGLHFFNPATLMPLVEVIPGIATEMKIIQELKNLMTSWSKIPVVCKDTPGFIVNRVARPFYGEAMRIYEEGIADFPQIDQALKEVGKFKMGPFELTDMIGHDVNYVVTETVWKQMYFDPRYKPSLCQKQLLDAGFLGKKTGRGFYNYQQVSTETPLVDSALAEAIFMRVIAMLINEAAEAVYLRITSKEEIELAMTKGVNYPKGLLHWADEIGVKEIYERLRKLQNDYGDDRYRPSVLLKRMADSGATFF